MVMTIKQDLLVWFFSGYVSWTDPGQSRQKVDIIRFGVSHGKFWQVRGGKYTYNMLVKITGLGI